MMDCIVMRVGGADREKGRYWTTRSLITNQSKKLQFPRKEEYQGMKREILH